MTVRDVAYGTCFAVGGCAGMFGAFWLYFMSSADPASWLARRTRPH